MSESLTEDKLHQRVRVYFDQGIPGDHRIVEGELTQADDIGVTVQSEYSSVRLHHDMIYHHELLEDQVDAEDDQPEDEPNDQPQYQKTIAMDFDGVIATYTTGQHQEIGTLIPGIKELIDQLRTEGWAVVIYSARKTHEIEGWLDDNAVIHDGISEDKPLAEIYVDDRALQFDGNVTNLQYQIANHRPWWQDLGSPEAGE